jgi:outer membrane protein
MKKLLFAGVAALTMFTATAQSKIGYINAEELISSMPEATKAQAEIKEFQNKLQQEFQDLTIDFNYSDSVFTADSMKLSPTMRDIKRKDLIEKYQRIQGLQQNSQEIIQGEANKKYGPIREKAMNAIRAAAKKYGYAYIINEDNNLLVAPAADNILNYAKAELGNVKAAPKPTTGAVKPAAGSVKRP